MVSLVFIVFNLFWWWRYRNWGKGRKSHHNFFIRRIYTIFITMQINESGKSKRTVFVPFLLQKL